MGRKPEKQGCSRGIFNTTASLTARRPMASAIASHTGGLNYQRFRAALKSGGCILPHQSGGANGGGETPHFGRRTHRNRTADRRAASASAPKGHEVARARHQEKKEGGLARLATATTGATTAPHSDRGSGIFRRGQNAKTHRTGAVSGDGGRGGGQQKTGQQKSSHSASIISPAPGRSRGGQDVAPFRGGGCQRVREPVLSPLLYKKPACPAPCRQQRKWGLAGAKVRAATIRARVRRFFDDFFPLPHRRPGGFDANVFF